MRFPDVQREGNTMKTVRKTLGECMTYRPEHPDRTARRALPGVFGDYEFRTWNARAPMARAIRLQERREPTNGDWRPLVPLADGEGY